MTIQIRDGGRLHVLSLWWTDAGMVEGTFEVRELGEGER
jgi:hypothetical protein